MSEPTAHADDDAPDPSRGSVGAWALGPRVLERNGRLAISYSGAVAALWSSLAAIGLISGLVSGGSPESRFFAFGLALVCAFVASFAVRPVIVADRTGLAVRPLFANRVAFRWDEVRGIGVRTSRRSRGRGASLEVLATEDRDVKVDGLAVGATRAALEKMDERLRAFAASVDVRAPIAVLADEPDGWDEPIETDPHQN